MTDSYMRGIERARLWWMIDVAPALETHVPDLYPYIAAGLVGDGSDCFGFDDETSMDHDTDTRVKIWMPMGMGNEYMSERIKAAIGSTTKGSVEVGEVPAFYEKYTGLEFSPANWREWLAIPQKNLAAATNGEVFYDGPGRFTSRRKTLLGYYPHEVCLKLLEGDVLAMGQAGQYNYGRSLRRGENVAAALAKATFMEHALSAVFILNKTYMPFYKWAHRAVRPLPILGEYAWEALDAIATATDAVDRIEEFSEKIVEELHRAQLSSEPSTFLVHHAHVLREQIIEPELREENPWKL